MYEELVNRNAIPNKVTTKKGDLDNLESNFDRKIEEMTNVFLEQL